MTFEESAERLQEMSKESQTGVISRDDILSAEEI